MWALMSDEWSRHFVRLLLLTLHVHVDQEFFVALRTIFTHFWAGVSNVHVYACLRNAYRLTSHGQGA